MHAYTAPAAGSGKSMLVDIASIIATGRETPVLAQGSTAEELEKRLGAAFLAGDATVSIDNCEQPLGSDLLCQVLTQPSVNIRLLGQSKNVEVLTNATLFATGNNLRLIGDLTRRALVGFLDPRCERPELREFATNPLQLIRQDRGRYVTAALTVLRAFHVAGRPQQVHPLGSFDGWSRWVRDGLIWAGEADPCETMERARAEDPQLERLRAVIHLWKETLGERQVSAAEIVESTAGFATADDSKFAGLREALLGVARVGNLVDARRLGNWLGRNKDRVVDGMRIVFAGIRAGTNYWQLVQAVSS
jgi:putative DNA primase/helicase